jgi:hypothetical protein
MPFASIENSYQQGEASRRHPNCFPKKLMAWSFYSFRIYRFFSLTRTFFPLCSLELREDSIKGREEG